MIDLFVVHVLILICIFLVLMLAFNLSVGYTGLINLGIIAFWGIGAYASALLSLNGVPFIVSFLVAGIAAGVTGFVLAWPTSRLKGDYLAMATLSFHFLASSVFLNWIDVTRGPFGITSIPRPEFFGFVLRENIFYLAFAVIVTALTLFFIHRLIHSPFGRVMAATRDDELATKVLGKNTFTVKAKVLGVSCFFAGISGAMLGHYLSFIAPSTFELKELVFALSAIIFGGLASLLGTTISTGSLFLIAEALRFLELPSEIVGPARHIIFFAILLAMLLYFPKGIRGKVELE